MRQTEHSMIAHVENPIMEVHDLTVSYSRKPVLWGVDFTLPRGAIAGIIGPNGAGKSTLLKAAMGLLPVASGYAKFMGQDLDAARNLVSYVPQRESVDWDFPVSVLDVVLMGRYGHAGPMGRLSREDRQIAASSLEKVGMSAFAKRQISQLSGGQQQRVFLARALAQQADLYLMDEPFAGVDAATEDAIFALFKEMAANGKTVIVVHHDLPSARTYFDWIVMLNMRLVASGPTAQVFTDELLQKTYGGKLSILSQLGEIIEDQSFPPREGE